MDPDEFSKVIDFFVAKNVQQNEAIDLALIVLWTGVTAQVINGTFSFEGAPIDTLQFLLDSTWQYEERVLAALQQAIQHHS